MDIIYHPGILLPGKDPKETLSIYASGGMCDNIQHYSKKKKRGEKNPKCLSTRKWTNKLCFIYRMENIKGRKCLKSVTSKSQKPK